MDSFDEVDFVHTLNPELLIGAKIKKDQWIFIARYFKIEYSHDITKQQLRDLVIRSSLTWI